MGILFCGCCFSNFSSKTNEILLIVGDLISLIFLIASLSIIQWAEIDRINLIFFVGMFVLVLLCFIFSVLLRCWRSHGEINTNKRNTAISLCTTIMVFKFILLGACAIEEVLILSSFQKTTKTSCSSPDIDYMPIIFRRLDCEETKIVKPKEYYISYMTLSYMEFILIFTICIIFTLKKRIVNKWDDNVPNVYPGGVVNNNYGRQVVVLHPQEMGYQNNNYYSQNLNFARQMNGPYNSPYYNQNMNNPEQVKVSSKYNYNDPKKIKDKNVSYASSSRSME